MFYAVETRVRAFVASFGDEPKRVNIKDELPQPLARHSKFETNAKGVTTTTATPNAHTAVGVDISPLSGPLTGGSLIRYRPQERNSEQMRQLRATSNQHATDFWHPNCKRRHQRNEVPARNHARILLIPSTSPPISRFGTSSTSQDSRNQRQGRPLLMQARTCGGKRSR